MKELILKIPLRYPTWRISDHILYKYVKERYTELRDDAANWKKVVAKEYRHQIISSHHDDSKCGIYKAFERIAHRYYWPKMRSDVATYVRKCTTCLAHKPEQQKSAGTMGSKPEVKRPWQLISMDLVGPLQRTTSGYVHILVVSDYFSNFCMLFPVRTANAQSVVQHIENSIFLLFGTPQYLVCDNGVKFRNSIFMKQCQEYKVR